MDLLSTREEKQLPTTACRHLRGRMPTHHHSLGASMAQRVASNTVRNIAGQQA